VLVTGGTDGIGLEVAHQMAAEGANICMVGRTKSKVDQKLKEIQENYQKIKTRGLIFDFAKQCLISDYKSHIAD